MNYRCAPNILSHAAKLIAHNQNRAPKKIIAHREDAGEIKVIRAPDRWSEADEIAETINRDQPDAQWVILARTNAILDAAELALFSMNRSFIRTGGRSVWEHSVGSVLVGLLRSILDDSWTGVANALSFIGIDAEWINDQSLRSSGGCVARLESALDQAKHSEDKRKALLALRVGLPSWREQVAKGRVSLVAHGIAALLADYCKPQQLKLLRKLEATVARMHGTLAQRLAILGRSGPIRRGSEVQIMTLHASKGLEFDNVWIMGCEDGNLPHADSTEEDERRLLYVGMTRARHRLILSSSIEDGLESRFLQESSVI
ncbi:3'-5' exonuclease [Tepidimonas charontis]|uniref:DNA 3'-5' helicase II n=1 Tax=Tepidimonas charontis TaxID=2267262 RepID=A0A554WYQ1_9BURK|nr:ATP-dependent helicase [Tepidimonas charontis]TSE28699.1 putative ATP-dependent DNA helicase YjcD [Tepidimonas charontis]